MSFFDAEINIFHQIWDIFSNYFWKYSFCPLFSETPIMHTLVCFMVSVGLWVYSFSELIFLFTPLKIISINCFQAHWFFVVYWNLQLSPSSKFWFQVLLIFNCKIYTWFFSIISISLHFLFGKTFFHALVL